MLVVELGGALFLYVSYPHSENEADYLSLTEILGRTDSWGVMKWQGSRSITAMTLTLRLMTVDPRPALNVLSRCS